MIGLFEPVCAPWHVDGVPDDFSFGQLQPDWDRMAPYVERAISRVPIAAEIGIRTFFCGPESFTPDLRPSRRGTELPGYFVAAGLNSIGILTGGGVGRVLAHWVSRPPRCRRHRRCNIDRLHVVPVEPGVPPDPHRGVAGDGVPVPLPGPVDDDRARRQVCRRCTPVSSPRARSFKDVSGWEGADWYAARGVTPEPGPLTWGRPGWCRSGRPSTTPAARA